MAGTARSDRASSVISEGRPSIWHKEDARKELGHGAGLAWRIRIWMLVIGLLPLLVLFLLGYSAARRALIEAGEGHLISVAQARREQIESWLRERVVDMEVISGSVDCISMVEQAAMDREPSGVCRYLDSFRTGVRDYQELALFDVEWNWVASNTGAVRQRGWLPAGPARNLVSESYGPVVAPIFDRASGRAGLQLAAKLKRPGGPPVGYIVAATDLTSVFTPILENRVGLGRSGRAYLVARSGEILVPTQRRERGGGFPAEPLRLPAGSSGAWRSRVAEGEELLAGFAAIPDRDWVLVVQMPQAEALELLHWLERAFVLVAALSVAAVIALSSRISLLLSAPLTRLAAAARRIAQGRHHERLPALEGREVAEVACAFNEMLDALEDTQRQRIQAKTLAAVGELSSIVVHEIRNPLSSIKMNLQALERRVRSEDAYAELAHIAVDQVGRIESLLTELLDYARPVELCREEVRVLSLLESTASVFRAECRERGIELRIEDRTGGSEVAVDRRRIEQALSNLVRNSMEAITRPGWISLRALRHADGFWALEVEDSGPGLRGIATEDLFRPFFTTKEHGTGLGLAHARKLVELHGGSIEGGGGAGSGALFRLSIPRGRRP